MAARTTTKPAPVADENYADKNYADMPKTTTAPATPAAPTTVTKFDSGTLAKIKTAPGWRPKDGDTIKGQIVTIVKRIGRFNDENNVPQEHAYPCVILDTGAEKFTAVHAFHGVLQNELREMKAKSGDDVTILFTGKRTANRLGADGEQTNYYGYSVVPTDGAELETFDFS